MGILVSQQRQGFMQVLASVALVAMVVASSFGSAVEAKGTRGKITGRSIGAGLCSLLIWPGIGQAINHQPGKKVATHAILGILPPVRFVSGYDAWVDRQGGYFDGKI